jgi:hypothetical protein
LKIGGNIQYSENTNNTLLIQSMKDQGLSIPYDNTMSLKNISYPPGLHPAIDDFEKKHNYSENENPKFDLTPFKKLKVCIDERRTKKKPNKKRSRLSTDSKTYDLFSGNLSYEQEACMISSSPNDIGQTTEKKLYNFRHESEESTSGDSENGYHSAPNSQEDTKLKILSIFL